LKSVDYSWQQKNSYENAEEIRNLGVQLYRRLCAMAEGMNHLGRDIEKCAASFNRTVKIMEKQVMPPARKFDALGVAGRDMPDLEAIDPSDASVTPFYKRSDHEV
ncbi:MAG: DNA recombination protein RmuC, partial [Desulfobacteraceae bacterium]|nr:DNA recombination protein RmuC [Desulfobacteraceae bacterium]